MRLVHGVLGVHPFSGMAAERQVETGWSHVQSLSRWKGITCVYSLLGSHNTRFFDQHPRNRPGKCESG